MTVRVKTMSRWVGAGLAAVAGTGAAIAATAAASGSTPAAITGGQTMTSGETLESTDGHYQATFVDGILSVSIVGGRTLYTEGSQTSGAYLVLQPNGSLVSFGPSGQVLWDSGTTGSGCPALNMQVDGDLTDYDTQNIWDSGTSNHGMLSGDALQPGWSIFSEGLGYRLQMDKNGNLELDNSAGTMIWASKTPGNSGAHAQMQSNGNFVVDGASGNQLWQSDTPGNPGATLTVSGSGAAEVLKPGGSVLWQDKPVVTPTNTGRFGVVVTPASSTACPSPVGPPATTVTVTTTATVTYPTTTVVTVPSVVSTPHHKRLDIRMVLGFRYRGDVTTLRSITVGRLPAHAELTATYDPHLRGRHPTVVHGVQGASLVRLVRHLRLLRYLPGQTLNVNLTRPGYQNEWATFTFRADRLPACRTASRPR